jgi:hypothetical protein
MAAIDTSRKPLKACQSNLVTLSLSSSHLDADELENITDKSTEKEDAFIDRGPDFKVQREKVILCTLDPDMVRRGSPFIVYADRFVALPAHAGYHHKRRFWYHVRRGR